MLDAVLDVGRDINAIGTEDIVAGRKAWVSHRASICNTLANRVYIGAMGSNCFLYSFAVANADFDLAAIYPSHFIRDVPTSSMGHVYSRRYHERDLYYWFNRGLHTVRSILGRHGTRIMPGKQILGLIGYERRNGLLGALITISGFGQLEVAKTAETGSPLCFCGGNIVSHF